MPRRGDRRMADHPRRGGLDVRESETWAMGARFRWTAPPGEGVAVSRMCGTQRSSRSNALRRVLVARSRAQRPLPEDCPAHRWCASWRRTMCRPLDERADRAVCRRLRTLLEALWLVDRLRPLPTVPDRVLLAVALGRSARRRSTRPESSWRGGDWSPRTGVVNLRAFATLVNLWSDC